MSSLEQKYAQKCSECGMEFLSKHKDTIYCSKTCKDKAWFRKHPNYMRLWKTDHWELLKSYGVNFRTKMTLAEKRRKSELTMESQKKYPQRVKARKKARRETSLESKCAICGTSENLQRHHPDYNKPLEVKTLCRSCHSQLRRGV